MCRRRLARASISRQSRACSTSITVPLNSVQQHSSTVQQWSYNRRYVHELAGFQMSPWWTKHNDSHQRQVNNVQLISLSAKTARCSEVSRTRGSCVPWTRRKRKLLCTGSSSQLNKLVSLVICHLYIRYGLRLGPASMQWLMYDIMYLVYKLLY